MTRPRIPEPLRATAQAAQRAGWQITKAGLFRECGKLSGLDPRHEHTYGIYESLSRIVYGLIEDE